MKYFLLGFSFFICSSFICCNNNKSSWSEDIDTCNLYMTDSFAIVYNTVTHRNETVKIARELPDGSTKVLPNGDTIYWIGGDCYGEGEYVSSEEWKEYVKK